MNILIKILCVIILGFCANMFLDFAFPNLTFEGRLYYFLSFCCFYFFIKIIEDGFKI